MRFYFIRDKEANIGVEVESTGMKGGDGSHHIIKITNPCSLNLLLADYQEETSPHYPRLESLEIEMDGDWEVSETIDALKYIVKCLEEVRDSRYTP